MLRYMKTEEFHELCHFRNGVEAIPSLLRRKYHVDKIPAHGKRQMRFYFGFKIAALDFQKLLDYTNSLDSYASNKKTAYPSAHQKNDPSPSTDCGILKKGHRKCFFEACTAGEIADLLSSRCGIQNTKLDTELNEDGLIFGRYLGFFG